MCNRPFETVEQMDTELIRNINEVVKQNDTLYIFGDINHRGTVEEANELISKIKCRNLILIKGNHDRQYDPSLFLEICDFKKIHAGYKGQNYSISLMHYPLVSWPNQIMDRFLYMGISIISRNTTCR